MCVAALGEIVRHLTKNPDERRSLKIRNEGFFEIGKKDRQSKRPSTPLTKKFFQTVYRNKKVLLLARGFL